MMLRYIAHFVSRDSYYQFLKELTEKLLYCDVLSSLTFIAIYYYVYIYIYIYIHIRITYKSHRLYMSLKTLVLSIILNIKINNIIR